MNKLLVGFVCVLVIASFLGGIVATNVSDKKEIVEMKEMQKFLFNKASESPVVNVTVEIPDITVNLTNSKTILNKSKEQEIITAKDIDFTVTELYIENSRLHLYAQTNISGETILLKITKITDSRDINAKEILIITDADGMIISDDRQITVMGGYEYKVDFYYNDTKIASASPCLAINGKLEFASASLATRQPNQCLLRITSQEYCDMRLSLSGETTVPIGQYIIVDIEGIDNNIATSKRIEVNSDGKILISEDERNIISAGLNEGRYKITLRDRTNKETLCILGFEVVKKKISEDEAVLKGIRWIQNFYTPAAA